MTTRISAAVGLLSVLVLTGCKQSEKFSHEYSFDFNNGTSVWSAGFADYDPAQPELFELASGIAALPSSFTGKGFMISGHNRSDDLFMFIKAQMTGLSPNTIYSLAAEVEFISNAGPECFGIGGAPGESVYMKVGHSIDEPVQQGYYLNVDKGQQSESGLNAVVIGNVAAEDASCDGSRFGKAINQTSLEEKLEVLSDGEGKVWIFIGTDSGYEGLTTLYYQHITLLFTPL